jgi:drug/metabolite transporter (DMT)-like permease
MRAKWIAYLKALFCVIFWGASFIATKIALREIAPVTVVWLRFAMGVLILGIAVIARKQFVLPGWKDLGLFSLLGFLGITFHQWLQSTGLVTAQASTSAWIVSTTPVFMAVLGWSFLKEKLGWWRVFGIALAALGVLLVVSDGDLGSIAAGSFGTPGDILILISAINWAVFSVISRRALQDHPPTLMMFFVMGTGWLFTSVLFFSESGIADVGHLVRDGWLGVAFLGIFCSGFAYILWYDALQELPASQLGVFLYIEPLVAAVVAALILGESLLFVSLGGGALILFGVWLVNRPSGAAHRARYRAPGRV